ncbi:MAG: ABC transporter permease [Candidatus Acidiferrales bacterium]
MKTLWQDLVYALRILRKSPGFTAIAVITLALGIGANTAIFSVINSALLEPLPFKNPAQLVSLRETENAPGDFPLSGADYLDWQKQNTTFASMSLIRYPQGMNASGAGEPESATVCQTEANFFATLGVQPLAGRTFAKGEDAAGKNRVAVLSYGFWQRHFGGERDAVGKTVELNDEAYEVIGVMPKWFNYPAATDIWTPIDINSDLMHNRGSHWASAIGRLKDGVSIAQAGADLLTVSTRISKQYRSADDIEHSLVFPLKERLVGNSRGQLLILFGAVALVLLVACANIANLLLARATTRQREMAVRAALGAGRWRLARQLLTESVLLALGGAALGALGASWGVGLLQNAETLPIPRINPVQVNVTVLLFTIGVSLLVGILFGLAPALHSSRLDLSEELKSSANAVGSAMSAGRTLRNSLIIAEIAVSLALLVGAGLLLRSFADMRSANIGVNPRNVLTMRLNLPQAKYSTAEARSTFCKELLAGIQQVPGVAQASLSNEIALEGQDNGYIKVPGNTNPALANQLVEMNWISPDYFHVFQIPLLEGRTLTEEDEQIAASVTVKANALFKDVKDMSKVQVPPELSIPVVINETMARTFWPGQDPVGKEYTDAGGGVPWRVIGVVGDEKQATIRGSVMPEAYSPITVVLQFPDFSTMVSVKTTIAPLGVMGSLRRALSDLDGALVLYHVRTMNDVIAENMQDSTVQTLLLSAFAALALVLAAVGLYGVMAYMVTQRTREIGIRMALGAQRSDALKLVMGHGAKLTAIGLAIGIAAALGLTQLLAASLYGVTATDPATYIAVAVLLAIVALAACYVPARRATAVDPMVALRYE